MNLTNNTIINVKRSVIVRTLKLGIGLFPLTLQGLITLLVTALCLSLFGYGSMDLVVFAIAICALAILVFCLFCSVISGVFVQRKIQRRISKSKRAAAIIKVEAGYPNETGFTLPTLNLLPLVKLSWKVVYPDFIETRTRVDSNNHLLEEIIPAKRFHTDNIVRQFTVSDVLGFCRYSWLQKQEIACMALPKTNTVKTLPLLRSLTAEDGIPNPSGDPEGDRMEIRPYAPGDSVRNIMWKVYARNRQLTVRLAEKSVFHSKRTVAYLLSSENDEAAAAVARMALESGALGEDWAFAADGTENPCENLPSALEAVARSRALAAPFSYGLDNFLSQAVGQAGGHCIVFAAAETATWLPLLKKTIGVYSGQFSLILATDGFLVEESVVFWRKLLFQESSEPTKGPETGSSRGELLNLLTELGQLVESTLVVDRKTGLSFDKSLRKV
jgi:hypothetical protein